MIVKPFSALRPQNKYVKECSALPYDVMSSEEARVEVVGKPYSFLHIDKAEIDLDTTVDLYSDAVYAKAAENLRAFEEKGVYLQDKKKQYYFYRQIMDGRAQTGIVGCASIDDYIQENVKKHELTRADKELDRIRHVDTCSAQTGPIFLAYKESKKLDEIILLETSKEPIYDFVSDDGIQHSVWATSNDAVNVEIEKAFKDINALYIADGHHRAASAVKAGLKRREKNPNYTGDEEFNYFLSVIFPADCLKIFAYNRLLKDTNGMTETEFIKKIETTLGKVEFVSETEPYTPQETHSIGVFIAGKWYKVKFNQEICLDEKPSQRLDCAILQKYFLAPVLGIADPRTDKRIDFVGGIRGLKYLETRCKEDMAVAISMYPVSMDELISVADANDIMPPKSTWFEPKLRSGIFIHKI